VFYFVQFKSIITMDSLFPSVLSATPLVLPVPLVAAAPLVAPPVQHVSTTPSDFPVPSLAMLSAFAAIANEPVLPSVTLETEGPSAPSFATALESRVDPLTASQLEFQTRLAECNTSGPSNAIDKACELQYTDVLKYLIASSQQTSVGVTDNSGVSAMVYADKKWNLVTKGVGQSKEQKETFVTEITKTQKHGEVWLVLFIDSIQIGFTGTCNGNSVPLESNSYCIVECFHGHRWVHTFESRPRSDLDDYMYEDDFDNVRMCMDIDDFTLDYFRVTKPIGENSVDYDTMCITGGGMSWSERYKRTVSPKYADSKRQVVWSAYWFMPDLFKDYSTLRKIRTEKKIREEEAAAIAVVQAAARDALVCSGIIKCTGKRCTNRTRDNTLFCGHHSSFGKLQQTGTFGSV